jgi:hypothetical protein
MKFLSPAIKKNAKINWEAYKDRLGRSEFRNTIFDLENLYSSNHLSQFIRGTFLPVKKCISNCIRVNGKKKISRDGPHVLPVVTLEIEIKMYQEKKSMYWDLGEEKFLLEGDNDNYFRTN